MIRDTTVLGLCESVAALALLAAAGLLVRVGLRWAGRSPGGKTLAAAGLCLLPAPVLFLGRGLEDLTSGRWLPDWWLAGPGEPASVLLAAAGAAACQTLVGVALLRAWRAAERAGDEPDGPTGT